VTRFDGISVRVTEFQHEPRRPKLLDLIQAMLKGDAPLPPIAQLIGFKLTSVTCGQAVIEFQAGEQHANPMGILHGGVFCDIADAAMGIAYASTGRRNSRNSGIEDQFSQAYLASVVHKGHTVGLG
jgi:acyl-coenzyme A thioesterase PaaI-like protein